jgi:hypothetical protein
LLDGHYYGDDDISSSDDGVSGSDDEDDGMADIGKFLGSKNDFFMELKDEARLQAKAGGGASLADAGMGVRDKGSYAEVKAIGRGVAVRVDDNPLAMSQVIADAKRRDRIATGVTHQYFQTSRNHLATHVALRQAEVVQGALLWTRLKEHALKSFVGTREHVGKMRKLHLKGDTEKVRRGHAICYSVCTIWC